MIYRILDVLIDSDILLPELEPATEQRTSIRIRMLPSPLIFEEQDWDHQWKEDEEITISMARSGNDFWIRFPQQCDFFISENNSLVEYQALGDLAPSTLRHLLLDQIVPRMIGQSGALVIHASAVSLDAGKAVVFLGDSGAGKSTTAAICAEYGAKIISDDCIMLRPTSSGLECIGNYQSLRLYEDSVVMMQLEASNKLWSEDTEKYRIEVDADSHGLSYSVEAIFHLGLSEREELSSEVEIRAVSGASSLMQLVRQMFLLDPTDAKVTSNQFSQLSALVNDGMSILELRYPWESVANPEFYRSIESYCLSSKKG